jgi:hypothetical protein
MTSKRQGRNHAQLSVTRWGESAQPPYGLAGCCGARVYTFAWWVDRGSCRVSALVSPLGGRWPANSIGVVRHWRKI